MHVHGHLQLLLCLHLAILCTLKVRRLPHFFHLSTSLFPSSARDGTGALARFAPPLCSPVHLAVGAVAGKPVGRGHRYPIHHALEFATVWPHHATASRFQFGPTALQSEFFRSDVPLRPRRPWPPWWSESLIPHQLSLLVALLCPRPHPAPAPEPWFPLSFADELVPPRSATWPPGCTWPARLRYPPTSLSLQFGP
jgi:hypothetical protein